MLVVIFKKPDEKLSPDTGMFEEILRGWHTLSLPLSIATSVDWCLLLLEFEKSQANREFIIRRIESRIIALGTTRVREEYDVYKKSK